MRAVLIAAGRAVHLVHRGFHHLAKFGRAQQLKIGTMAEMVFHHMAQLAVAHLHALQAGGVKIGIAVAKMQRHFYGSVRQLYQALQKRFAVLAARIN